jgi:hypothetical protein
VPLSRAEAGFLYDLLTDYLASGGADPAAARVLAKLEAVVGEGQDEG